MPFSSLKAKEAASVFGPPLSPSATEPERQAYRRDVLHLPGPVDRWLVTNIRSPRINFLQDYLLLIPEDIKISMSLALWRSRVRWYVHLYSQLIGVWLSYFFAQLLCTDRIPERLTTYTLYIKAIASPQSRNNLILRTSPRAILERFTGSNKALNAPDWTSWERKACEFQQPKLNFASLFVRMAEWEENRHEVCSGHF